MACSGVVATHAPPLPSTLIESEQLSRSRKLVLQWIARKALTRGRESFEIWYSAPNEERPGDTPPGLDAVRSPPSPVYS
jgi:hypothetical protein